jgi:hypothetical protein
MPVLIHPLLAWAACEKVSSRAVVAQIFRKLLILNLLI